MPEFLHFLSQHLLLSAAFMAVLITLVILELRTPAQHSSLHLSIQKTVQMNNRDLAVLLDLRDSESYNHGHIIGAKNLPEQDIQTDKKVLKRLVNKTIIIINDTGVIKPKTHNALKQAGIANIKTMSGGMRAWSAAHMPVTTGEQSPNSNRRKKPANENNDDSTPSSKD